MSVDPLAPAEDTPPRQIDEWTSVRGHQVTIGNDARARCSCGSSQPLSAQRSATAPDSPGRPLKDLAQRRRTARAWRNEHLAHAWPILVPPQEDESLEEHAVRIKKELAKAQAHRDELNRQLDLSQDPIPVIERPHLDAGIRAAVLKQQYNEICARLRRQHQVAGTGEELRWAIQGAGDPYEEV
jgi:hypothetical protein